MSNGTSHPRVSIASLAVTTPRVKKLENSIKNSVTRQMRLRLGLSGNQKLPADVRSLINAASATAAETTLETAIVRDVEDAAADAARGSVLDRFDTKVGLARKGLDHIQASDDVGKILKRRAEMLAKKKAALETAGFSTEEAMEILLADIGARGH